MSFLRSWAACSTTHHVLPKYGPDSWATQAGMWLPKYGIGREDWWISCETGLALVKCISSDSWVIIPGRHLPTAGSLNKNTELPSAPRWLRVCHTLRCLNTITRVPGRLIWPKNRLYLPSKFVNTVLEKKEESLYFPIIGQISCLIFLSFLKCCHDQCCS